MEELQKRGMDDVIVWAGGIIPEADQSAVRGMGITRVFGPGTPTTSTVDFLRRVAIERGAGEASTRQTGGTARAG
jgi:methylmalonyl-CoA mutase C-terminal domain/subunit